MSLPLRTPRVITPPAVEPVSLEEARLHLRLDAYDSPATHPDDPLVTALISAAREWAEAFTGRSIAETTLELALDSFVPPLMMCAAWPFYPARPGPWSTCPIVLPRGPVVAIDSIVYIDGDGAQQALTGYQLDLHSEPPRILPAIDTSWPSTATELNAVRIRYTAGYSLSGDSPNPYPLPQSIKHAILLLVGHLYENRESTSADSLEEIPFGVEALLRPYRLETGMA